MSVFNFLALAVAAIGSYLLLFKYWPLGPAAGSELKHIARVGQAGRTLRMSRSGFMFGKPRVSQKSSFHRVFIQS